MMKCCLKSCDSPGRLIQIGDGRVEVKTALPKRGHRSEIQNKLLIEWDKKGEAVFHLDCWEKSLHSARSRSKKSLDLIMIREEKILVKTAYETAEKHDKEEEMATEGQRVAQWIKNSKHCVAFTGAGISTSAGIGDYRGKAGKWTEDDHNKTDMESLFGPSCSEPSEGPQAKKYRLDSEQEVKEDDEVEEDGVAYEKLRPTYTHEAMQKMMHDGYLKYIISQNGDGLHGLSGIPLDRMSELHGNVFVEKCTKCGTRYKRPFYVLDDSGSQYFEELEDYGKATLKKPAFARKCHLCGLSHRTGRNCEKQGCNGPLMDTIINFHDNLEEEVLSRAEKNAKDADLMLCFGTTLKVTPASDLVEMMKEPYKLVICNRQDTHLDQELIIKGPTTPSGGTHVFGDCDVFMRKVMKYLYSKEELDDWEAAKKDRMEEYDKQRTTV